MKTRFPSREAAAWYLAAMVDGEGTITFAGTGRHWIVSDTPKVRARSISIAGTESDLMEAVQEALEILGFDFNVLHYDPPQPNWRPKTYIYLRGGKEAFQRFQQEVPIQSERKQRVLAALLGAYRPQRPSAVELRRLYYEERWSLQEIADHCGVSIGSVHRWMRLNDVERRSLSQAGSLWWGKRKDNAI